MHARRKRLGQDMDAPKRAYTREIPPNGGHAVGEIIGTRRLIEYAGTNRLGQHLWIWECPDCGGRNGPSTISHLKRASRCHACALSRDNNPRWLGHQEITGVWLWSYKAGARDRGLAWDLTPEQIWAQWLSQDGRCAYTGWPLTHGVDASLDRIDSAIGYTPANIQFVHRDINRMKWDLSDSRFRLLCEAVATNGVQTPERAAMVALAS